MPRAAKACSHPDCPNVQPCPDHRRKAWQGSTRRSRLPGNWKSLRLQILERDPICVLRIACDGSMSTVCDHRIPGDDHSPENLQGICSACDRLKSSREGNEAQRQRRMAQGR